MNEIEKLKRHMKTINYLVDEPEGRQFLVKFIAAEAKLAHLLGEDVFNEDVSGEAAVNEGSLPGIDDTELANAAESPKSIFDWLKKFFRGEWAKTLFSKLNDLVKAFVGGGGN